MLKFLLNLLFPTPMKPPLSDDERMIEALDRNECPDCGAKSPFLGGPCGGMSQNILCDECGSEFNYCRDFVSLSHRNSDHFRPERNWAFGLPADWTPTRYEAPSCENDVQKSSSKKSPSAAGPEAA